MAGPETGWLKRIAGHKPCITSKEGQQMELAEKVKKLESVRIELVTLVSRLTQPFRGFVESSIKLLDEVIEALKEEGEK